MTSSAEVQVHKAVQPEQKEEVQNPEPPSEKVILPPQGRRQAMKQD